jgi:hypothetical protein
MRITKTHGFAKTCTSDTSRLADLTGCDHFVEQREHSRMAYCVVDINERGGTVAGTQSFMPKLVGRIEVMGELVSRSNDRS